MLEPLDRCRRDSTLFQFTEKRLRDFIDPDHLLIQIDEQLDFGKLVAPLENRYCRDYGRPAVHPEVMVRALLICSLYNIASFRRLCSAISENIAFRWFCFLTIDDPVFDHSTISYFIERVWREGFGEIFHGLNHELLRLGLLSPQLYADGSLVKANVSGHHLAPSGLTVDEFKERAVEENGLFVLYDSKPDQDGAERKRVRYFQDSGGRINLSPVDTDARWGHKRHSKSLFLSYLENLITDFNGFIVARKISHSSEGEWKAVPELLDQVPVMPESLAADTAYNSGRLRRLLDERGITAYIPIHPNQESNMVSKGGFAYRGDHLICPQGKRLQRSAFHHRDEIYQYVARQNDCQTCPVKAECLPPNQKRRYVALSMHYPLHLRAREQNQTPVFRREMRRRQTTVDGAFASLDRLGWARSRPRGLWKVDCEGFMAAIAHNVLKAVRRLGERIETPGGPVPG